MVQNLELYRCSVCGNIVEVVINGEGKLVCCGKEMDLLEPKTNEDEKTAEKHVPYIEKTSDGRRIQVGVELHPMLEEHYIEFIEVISPDNKYSKTKYLSPGDKPLLELKCDCDKIKTRAYCNIHGLWESKEEI